MSIFDLIQNLMSKPKNPELDKVRQQHDNLPTSKYFDDTNISDEVFYMIIKKVLREVMN